MGALTSSFYAMVHFFLVRVLDPLIYELLDPAIKQKQQTTTLKERQIRGFVYTRPFDHNRIAYIFEMLLLISQFGGQTFNRIVNSSVVRQIGSQDLIERFANSKFVYYHRSCVMFTYMFR